MQRKIIDTRIKNPLSKIDLELKANYTNEMIDALYKKDNKRLKLMLEKGADSNIRIPISHNINITPIFIAIEKNNTKAVELLIKHNAKINIIDDFKRTPLLLAYQENRFQIIKIFLKNKANLDHIYYEKGIHIRQLYEKKYTLLHLVLCDKNLKIAKLILQYPLNPDIQDINSKTYLHFAAQLGFYNIVKLLIEKGADPHIKDINDAKAVALAKDPKIIKYLNNIELVTK